MKRIWILCAVVGAACAAPSAPTRDSPRPQVQATPESTPPPVARLSIKTGGRETAGAIAGASQVLFDATASTGLDLTYTVRLGDGRISTLPNTVAVFDTSGRMHPHLTVTDRFNRASVADTRLTITTLTANVFGYMYWQRTDGRDGPFTNGGFTATQNGRDLTGWLNVGGVTGRYTGTIVGDTGLRLELDNGATIEGLVIFEPRSTYDHRRLELSASWAPGATLHFAPFWY